MTSGATSCRGRVPQRQKADRVRARRLRLLHTNCSPILADLQLAARPRRDVPWFKPLCLVVCVCIHSTSQSKANDTQPMQVYLNPSLACIAVWFDNLRLKPALSEGPDAFPPHFPLDQFAVAFASPGQSPSRRDHFRPNSYRACAPRKKELIA